jgi:aryl-alcohol dehydrogenase
MPSSTTAAVLPGPGRPFELTEAEIEAPRAGEALIELAGTGVCHTDLSVAGGGLAPGMPVVLGHEGAGVVVEVGEGVSHISPGDGVVLSYAHCDACVACRSGRPAYCEDALGLNFSCRRSDGSTALRADGEKPLGSHFFGQSSFARHAVVHASSAVPVDARPAELPLLGPLGCSVQTGAGTLLHALAPAAGLSVAIFGAGAVGLSALMAAPAAGAGPVHVIEPDPGRRELALELGAAEALDPAAVDVARTLRKLTHGGAGIAIDTVGTASVIGAAIASLRSPGRCATLALHPGANPIEVDQSVLLFGRTLEGVIEGDTVPAEFIPRLVALWREGRMPIERLIRTYPFEEIGRACEDARSGATIKPVLTFGAKESDS